MRITALLLCAIGLVFPPSSLSAQDSPTVLMQQKHWKRVRAIAQSKLKASADDAEANYMMSQVLLAWDDPGAALPYAEKAVKLSPQNTAYRWGLAQILGEQAERANVFRQIGLAKRFRSETETILKLDPKHVEAHYGMMMYYFKAPGIIGGDKKKAYLEAEEIGKIDRAKGYVAQARLAGEAQQPETIEDLYKAAIEADPKLVDAYTSLIHLTVTKDRASDVERYGRHLIAIEPKRTVGYNALTWSFVKQKRWADLDQLLAEAEAAIPDDFMPYYVAANTLLASKDDVPKAERYFRKYLSQEREAGTPSHALAHWRLGLVLEQQGRKADAIAALETAVKADASLEQAKKDLTRLKAN